MPLSIIEPNSTISSTGYTIVGSSASSALAKGVEDPTIPNILTYVSVAAGSVSNILLNLGLEDISTGANVTSISLKSYLAVQGNRNGQEGLVTITPQLVLDGQTLDLVNGPLSNGSPVVSTLWYDFGEFDLSPLSDPITQTQFNSAKLNITTNGDVDTLQFYAVYLTVEYNSTTTTRSAEQINATVSYNNITSIVKNRFEFGHNSIINPISKNIRSYKIDRYDLHFNPIIEDLDNTPLNTDTTIQKNSVYYNRSGVPKNKDL